MSKDIYMFMVEHRPDFSKAPCVGAPESIFFPRVEGRGGRISRKELAEARKYCNRCPVKAECLEYACRTDSVGIWGGEFLSEHLARKLRKQNGWTLHREIVSDS
jgi:hypothetical protein